MSLCLGCMEGKRRGLLLLLLFPWHIQSMWVPTPFSQLGKTPLDATLSSPPNTHNGQLRLTALLKAMEEEEDRRGGGDGFCICLFLNVSGVCLREKNIDRHTVCSPYQCSPQMQTIAYNSLESCRIWNEWHDIVSFSWKYVFVFQDKFETWQ